MAKDLLSKSIRDTNTYTSEGLPINGDDAVLQIANNLDEDVDYTVEATYDTDSGWNDVIELGSGTVTSGSVVREGLSEPWDKIRISVTAQTTPTANEITVKAHTN